MGRPIGKKKDHEVQKPGNAGSKHSKSSDRNSKAFDEDTAIFIKMSHELKEEGNKLYQRSKKRHDHEGAMLKYEKTLILLPHNHFEVAHLHSSMAACYIQMSIGEYPRAINECNLALVVSPKYTLNWLDLVLRDVNFVLNMEPNNLSAMEILASVKRVMNEKGISGVWRGHRWAPLPVNCSMPLAREIVRDRFPGLKGVLVKYKDQESDLVTITTTDELRIAESSSDMHGPLRLFIAEVSPDQEPIYKGLSDEEVTQVSTDNRKPSRIVENGDNEKDEVEKRYTYVEDWVIQFARLFKNHLGVKIYSEAMEDTVTLEDAQERFDIAADKFQEMVALALFNWGNVHMSKARKRVSFPEDASRETIIELIKAGYEWANNENKKADGRYEEAVKINPTSTKAEDNMDRGMLMWEGMEERRLNGLSKEEKYYTQLQKLGLDGLIQEVSAGEAAEHAANMKSQIYLLWGTLLYERSVVEYKLGLPTWEECLEVSVEKLNFVELLQQILLCQMINFYSYAGLGFKIDEIIHAWNEMYDAQRWQFGVPSFRLEPLLRQRVPKLHSILEHAGNFC
ncbi:unnamed protein product [Malus baccata var. baccata]